MNYSTFARKMSDDELAHRLLMSVDRPRTFKKDEKEAYIREAAKRIRAKRVFLA